MADFGPVRVALDAHAVGRRATGNETYIVNLARALSARRDVDPIVYVDGGTDWPAPEPRGLRRLTARTPFLRIPIELPIRSRRDRADLLHVQYVGPPVVGMPLVTTIHDLSFEEVPGLFPRLTELRLKVSVRGTVRRSRAILTVSTFTRDRLVDRYGLDPGRIFVTPNGVNARWRPIPVDERERELGPLRLPRAFVLAVGSLHPRKNIPRLVRAVAAARATGIGDLHLVVAGPRGWRAREVDAAIEEVGGGVWTHLLGYVSDDVLRALYGTARVVAYPSMYEGFGLPVIEALACGAVVVASATTSIPEVAGDAAVLVDPTSDASVTAGLLRADSDEALRGRLATAGPARAATFTWERCAEQTVGAYRAALGRDARTDRS